MQAEPTNSTHLLSFLDYRATYQEPIFDLWDRRGSVAQALFRAFRPWSVSHENINRSPNPSDNGDSLVSVEIPGKKRVSFSVGLTSAGAVFTNPVWDDQAELLAIVSAGIEAVRSSLSVSISRQLVSLGMHLQPQGRTILDITSNLVRPIAALAGQDTPTAFGFSVYSENAIWVVDRSAVFPANPGALFIRLTRNFPPDQPLVELANTLRAEQEKTLDILKLRITP